MVRMGRELEILNGKDGQRAGDIEWYGWVESWRYRMVRMGRELEISNGKDGQRAGDIEW